MLEEFGICSTVSQLYLLIVSTQLLQVRSAFYSVKYFMLLKSQSLSANLDIIISSNNPSAIPVVLLAR